MNTSNFWKKLKQILKIITTILSWTLFCVLVIIIGFLAYYLICTNIYAAKGAKYEPKYSLYTIISPSMEPTIKVYDVILDEKIDDMSKIQKGDVITFISTSFISKGMTVTHRVVDVIDNGNGIEFKTQGDNNLEPDTDTAKAENVLGRVVLKIPKLGKLQFFLASNGGWLIVVLIPALFIIVNDVFKILKLNKTKKQLDETKEDPEEIEEKRQAEEIRKEKLKKKFNFRK